MPSMSGIRTSAARPDRRSASRPALRPAPHPVQAATAPAPHRTTGQRVDQLDPHVRQADGDPQCHRLTPRVLGRVGQPLLDDAATLTRHGRGKSFVDLAALRSPVHRPTGSLDDPAHPSRIRCGQYSSSRSSVAFPHETRHVVQVVDRGLRSPGELRVGVEYLAGRARLERRDRQRVANRVVQLAGKPVPLGQSTGAGLQGRDCRDRQHDRRSDARRPAPARPAPHHQRPGSVPSTLPRHRKGWQRIRHPSG